MGAINNAFIQGAGAVAGAAIATKNIKEAELSKTLSADSSALVARNQSREADAEYAKAKNEADKSELYLKLAEADTAKEEAKKAYEKAARRKNAAPTTVFEKWKAAGQAKKAFESLKDEYDSVIGMRDRAIEQREHANALTKQAIKLQKKYKSRWGGIE